MFFNSKFKKIIKELNSEINDNFDVDKILFVSVFGSWARQENHTNSDLDLLIVFRDDYNFSKNIEKFKNGFIKLHLKYGLNIDHDYLGEYISISKLEKTLNGYGFVKKDNKVLIPLIYKNNWNKFNEYRQWLCAIALPSYFILGDYEKYLIYKEKSLEALLKVYLLNKDFESFNLKIVSSDLVKSGKEFLGFCDSPKTKKYLDGELPKIFKNLIHGNYIFKKNHTEYKINRDSILESLILLTSQDIFNLRKKFIGELTEINDKNILNDSLDFGLNFMLDNEKILEFYEESEIKKRFEGDVPQTGSSLKEVFEEYKKNIADGSIHQSSRNYLAFPDSANSTAALVASILENFTNQNLIATIKSAPTGTFVEIQVIRWLRQLIGFPNAEYLPESALGVGGFMTSCGTLANTTALLVARCKSFPTSRVKGLQSENVKPILIVASDTLNHYSHIAGFWWLGLGEENIVFVKSKKDFRFDLGDLENKIIEYNDGVKSKVIAVIALAGDSRTTTIENFEKISEITNKHKVWLHVDACHGGVLIFSKKHRDKIKGINNANSISIDPHKGLGVPYSSSAVLFKDVEDLALISKSTDITIQNGSTDLGQITSFLGSRPFDSLKLWFLIKHLGTEGIEDLISHRLNLAEKWSELIQKSELFESINEPDLNSVVFSLSPTKIRNLFTEKKINLNKITELNKKVHDYVYEEGKICIHSFDIFDIGEKIFPSDIKVRVLGVTMGNPYTSSSDFNDYISYLEKVARNIIKKI